MTSKENCGRIIKCGDISGNEHNSLAILSQAYGSDSSSDERGNDLFDVPVSTHDSNLYLGCEMKNYTNSGGECLPAKRNSLGSGSKPRKPRDKNGQKRSYKCRLKDDDLLISAIIKKKSCKSTAKQSKVRKTSYRSKSFRKHKKQKGSCRLLPRSSGMHCAEGNFLPLGSRTVLSWLINTGNISLNEVVQYRNTKDDTVVKDGFVTWDGILCRCCNTVLSVSEFKSHAGFRLNRPCLNLYMESGKPFTICQLEAWSAEYKARKSPTPTVRVDELDENDDSCGLCGVEGELICCDNCPSTFHQACLYEQVQRQVSSIIFICSYISIYSQLYLISLQFCPLWVHLWSFRMCFLPQLISKKHLIYLFIYLSYIWYEGKNIPKLVLFIEIVLYPGSNYMIYCLISLRF